MNDYFPAACYNCGQPGHYASDCPERNKAQRQHHGDRVVPPPAPPRKPASQVADASTWAAKIRTDMGWAPRSLDARKEGIAQARQALAGGDAAVAAYLLDDPDGEQPEF